MTQFIQLHLLAAYPPSNPNRDDTGRPKTAIVGGALRQRISSQALKRAWRVSSTFSGALDGYIGKRTKRIGLERIYPDLVKAGYSEAEARRWSREIQKVYGKPAGEKKNDPESGLLNEQLVHVTPSEEQALKDFVQELGLFRVGKASDASREIFEEVKKSMEKQSKKGKGKESASEDSEEEGEKAKGVTNLLKSKLLNREHMAADIALFGRMLASHPEYNTEAACQVANAITVHRVDLDDDFFTAVDDLNTRREDMGSGHMGETGFSSGLYYLYLCIDADQLKENLSDDKELAKTTLQAILEAAATVAPSGMQNRFGNRVCASYILAERGTQQPRNLSVAFFNPIDGRDLQTKAIEEMEKTCAKMDEVYGPRANQRKKVTIISKTDKEAGDKKRFVIEDAGALAKLKQFVCGVYDV